MTMSPMQARSARVALGLGVRELSDLADVSPMTISRFETSSGDFVRQSAIEAQARIRRALEAEGVTFLDAEPGLGAGIRVSPEANLRISKKSGARKPRPVPSGGRTEEAL